MRHQCFVANAIAELERRFWLIRIHTYGPRGNCTGKGTRQSISQFPNRNAQTVDNLHDDELAAITRHLLEITDYATDGEEPDHDGENVF